MALSGRFDEGVDLLEEGLRVRDTQRIGMFRSLNLGQLGHAYHLAGDQPKALRAAEEALVSARDRGERGQEAHALRVLAEIAAAAEPRASATARGLYHEALALGGELGMRPLVAHCHLGFGNLYRRTGKGEEAREHLITATTMYREMDMRFWLEQAEAGRDT
jgi:tetratricopeptide (TPR) repeat protein